MTVEWQLNKNDHFRHLLLQHKKKVHPDFANLNKNAIQDIYLKGLSHTQYPTDVTPSGYQFFGMAFHQFVRHFLQHLCRLENVAR